MHSARKFRLYPTKAHRITLAAHFGCTRWVYNWGLEQCKKSYAETGKHPRYSALQAMLPGLKREHEWLREGNAQSLQVALQNLTTAFEEFFGKRGGYPCFKKLRDRQAVTFPQDVWIAERQPNDCLWPPNRGS